MKKYNLVLTAATFLILDSSEDSMEVSIHLGGGRFAEERSLKGQFNDKDF